MDASAATIPEATTNGAETKKEEDAAAATGSADVEMKEVATEAVEPSEEKEETAEDTLAKPNGESEPQVTELAETLVDSTQQPEDEGMKDTAEPNAVATATPKRAPAVTNGTPASIKRGGNGGSSKKKNSVPEHKSKKLQKKKSRPLTNLDAQPGQYYFARMKGHPPWPSVICDEAMLPVSLLTTRPVTAKLADGSFKKVEYADGGKRAHERTFPVMFLHTNEFAWIPNTELTPLDPEDESVKTPVEKGKSKTLLAAYAIASENNDLNFYKTMLADHQKAIADDQAEKEAREAEKEAREAEKEARAAKKTKKSRKSDASLLAEDDMDVDEDEAAEKPKSKKRKKAEDSEVEEKPAKTPKTATKLKLSEPKDPAESATKKKSAKSKAKAAKSSSEDDAKTEEASLTPEAAFGMKERKVLYYRHKLQRSMLNRDSMPKESEMKSMSDYLNELETYPDLEATIIRRTKIHKVLKNIIKLTSIPLEEQYHFKDRSRDLLAKWNETLTRDPSGGADGADDKADESKIDSAPPATNGASASEDKVEDASVDAAPEPEPTSEATKIGTGVEGEAEAEQPAAEDKAAAQEDTAEEKTTDAPAVDSKPEAEYHPPTAAETVEETAA